MDRKKLFHILLGALLAIPLSIFAADWYEATGKPVQRAALSSADLRSEFALVETNIADKLPTLTGNNSKLIAVNSTGTALVTFSALSSSYPTPSNGTLTASFDDACTTTPTWTIDAQVVGNIVTMWITAMSGFACTSDSINFRTTGSPITAGLLPTTEQTTACFPGSSDNSVTINAAIRIQTNGNLTLIPCPSAGSATWTAAGLKTWAWNASWSYGLGNP